MRWIGGILVLGVLSDCSAIRMLLVFTAVRFAEKVAVLIGLLLFLCLL